MRTVYLDIETYSDTPISAGAHRYAENAEILLVSYAIGGEPVKVWDLTDPDNLPDEASFYDEHGVTFPRDLYDALMGLRTRLDKGRLVMHNGMNFDSIVLAKYFPRLARMTRGAFSPRSVEDTMVLAYEAGLPGALGDLCTVFKLPVDKSKDKDGSRLVHLFCKPLGANRKLDRATRFTHPEDWARFKEYCRRDVESMRVLHGKIPRFNDSEAERRLQILDAQINRRGMAIDLELARAAVEQAERSKASYDRKTAEATAGAVMTTGQRDALIEFMHARFGKRLDALTKTDVEKAIEDPDTPAPMRELLAIRQAASRTSVVKFKKLLECTSSDGRLRGTLQFRGASRTGRWSGRLFQPQNLARPTIKSQDEIEFAVGCTKTGILDQVYDDPIDVLTNLLRGVIVAGEGKKLCVADFSNVEGRVLAWLAGEDWKLEAFREFDTLQAEDGSWVTPDRLLTGEHPPLALNAKGETVHKGHDLYKVTYGRTFGKKPEDVTKPERQMGKVLELALGYGGGAGAFATFAKGYGIDLHDMAATVKRTVRPDLWDAAVRYYPKAVEAKRDGGLDEPVFLACDAVKRAWREANPAIAGLWKAMDDALHQAMTSPVCATVRGSVTLERKGAYLLMRLPSGRFLVYPSPAYEPDGGSAEPVFTYFGVHQKTRKWQRIESHGAKLVENLTQAVACDLLGEALTRLTDAGYEPVLTIHDEILAEASDSDSSFGFESMARVMSEPPVWCPGLPLAAAGFEGRRYRKD